ncbi:MAG: AI-2E family transporter [Desulfobacterales bacterium]|nr:AI-2E family transporter [Desulfobacterales bacterium]MCP4159008.1 AI-2E family transporter [Deltaproteobacteria bacterium]
MNTEEDANTKHGHYFLFFLLFLGIYTCYGILKPYLNPIIIALILAAVIGPVHRRIEKKLKNKKNIAAGLSCLLLTFVVIIPFTIVMIALFKQAAELFININEWVKGGNLTNLIATLKELTPGLKNTIPGFDKLDLEAISLDAGKKFAEFILGYGKELAGDLISIFGSFALMIFSFFFFVRDEKEIYEYVLHLVPLSTSHEDEILKKANSVSKSVLLGTFATAIAQGVAGAIAFGIADLPWLFWGVMMAFASLIPVVGTALIWIPSTIYLALTGHTGMAIFVFIWCVVVVGGLDNVVRPLFMKGSANMSTFLIFFSILGGINFFGMIGLIYGPLIFGLVMVLLYIYNLEFEHYLNKQDSN